MLLNILKNIGMNGKEARIYLACLELGPSVVSDIAEKANVNRVTAYDILERLVKKGIVNFLIQGGIKQFSATDPEIVSYEFQRRTQELKKALPQLRRLGKQQSSPHIQYFEGLDGIKAIYADTLHSQTDILNYANSKEIRTHWPEYDTEYVEERKKRRIYLRGIAPDDASGKNVVAHDKESYREIRLVPERECPMTNEINIYDDKVAIVSFKDELIGMIIESREIAETQRTIFKMAWQFAEQFLPKKKR